MMLYLNEVKIDLERIVKFFENHTRTPMPRMVRELVLSGGEFTYGDLKTNVIEWRHLKELWTPEIAKKIAAPTTAYQIPVIRRVNTPRFFVYEPTTGEYLGKFNIKL